MNAAEFNAAMPEPHTILGLRLLPLSIGRYRLLKRFDSPFVDDEKRELTIEDMIKELIFALVVCGLPCAEFNALLNEPQTTASRLLGFPVGLERECKRFGKVIQKVIKRTPNFSIFESLGEFREYLNEAQSVPWHVSRLGEESESVSHWSHNIEIVLRSRIGWSQEEVDEQPLQKGLCDFFKFLEGEGAVRLMTHEDWAVLEAEGEANSLALEKMNAEFAAMGGNN